MEALVVVCFGVHCALCFVRCGLRVVGCVFGLCVVSCVGVLKLQGLEALGFLGVAVRVFAFRAFDCFRVVPGLFLSFSGWRLQAFKGFMAWGCPDYFHRFKGMG